MKHALSSRLLIAACSFMVLSCHDKEKDEPEVNYETTKNVAENIVGKWLLSTSDAKEWMVYDITATSRINAEFLQYGRLGAGSGYYSIENDKFTGSYTPDDNRTVYVDWVVTEIKPFEIGLKIYDNEVFIENASIYRILSTVNVYPGSSCIPDYRAISGSNSNANFSVIDGSIAAIDPKTGEISGKHTGSTYVTYATPNGTCAVKVSVTEEPVRTFGELLIGTWVYDSPTEKVWERYTYEANGYLAVQWETYDNYELEESKQAMYTINGESVSFTITLDVGQLNMRMETESINEFNWTYSAYDGTHALGKYTAQRRLESVTLLPGSTGVPEYKSLVGSAVVQGFKSHDEAVAQVNSSGVITAISGGRTYIDVKTDKGTGVVEVYVGRDGAVSAAS